jgi:hypothetical protein
MRHKSFGNMQYPIASSLERVGEWWSIPSAVATASGRRATNSC